MAAHVDVLGISDQVIVIFSWVFCGVVCQVINMFGIVTNIINIKCFSKQGLKESMNISLIGLSVSDLGSLTTMALTCISLTPAFMAADWPFEPLEVTYLTSTMVHFAFTRVSSCITAMITLERCLCITAPLKIKSVITTKRTSIIMCCVFLIFFCSGAPIYFVNKLGQKFSPKRNKTILGLVSSRHKEQVEPITFAINNFCIPFIFFVIIIVCATVLSFQLRRQAKWREKTINSSQVDRTVIRNQKTAKMVVMISTLFIACFVPVTIIILVAGCLPELSVNGPLINITLILGMLAYIMESLNASLNILIYYHMSTKYRETFHRIFQMASKDYIF